MSENKGLDFLDYLILIARWKKFLLVTFFGVAIISYVLIYLTIDEQYEASALIIPSEQNRLGGFSSLLKDLSSLPLNIGGTNFRNDNDFYTAIINSRTNLEKVISKFDLVNEYEVKNVEEAIKVLKTKIKTDETDEEAFQINVMAGTPEKAAVMTNFIIDELNKTVISMNVQKSRENRLFLEKRYNEIKISLKNAEDSLKNYQQVSGIYAAEDQAKAVIEAYTKLESELAVKQVELSVFEKIYGKNSPQTNAARIAANQFAEKINEMKRGKEDNLIVGTKSLPEKAMNYLRNYRDVEIYNAMLEFIIPLYEQARFEEQKDIPILQVIDYAVPPVKRAYPQRTIMSVAIALAITLLVMFYIIMTEIFSRTENPKLIALKEEISIFRKKK